MKNASMKHSKSLLAELFTDIDNAVPELAPLVMTGTSILSRGGIVVVRRHHQP